ncbi:MAG: Ig-like domain-containing protein, partial [Anaerolineales bacterium]
MKRLLLVLFFSFWLVACGPATLPTQSLPQATPTAIPFTLPTPAAAPQIIRQRPLPQERLSITPTIEITFDRPMERASLEKAWKFADEAGNIVAGTFTWKDAQTVQFHPDAPLQPGHVYILTIGAQATDQQGVRLGMDWQFTYHTSEALQVAQVFPASGTSGADPTTAITVIFNKPVVPLSPEETPEALPSPLEFDPPIPGEGRWVSSSVYIFQPEKPLRGGQTYRGLIRAGLQDVTGIELEEEFRWEFGIRPLRVLEVLFLNTVSYDNEERVRLDGQIQIRFDHPIERATLNRAMRISAPDGSSIPFRTKWNDSSDTVTIIPLKRYQPATRYTLTISTDLRAQDGSLLDAPQSTNFFTLPYPAVISFFPQADKTFYIPYAVLQFNTLMNKNSIIAHLQITPRPPKLDFYYNEWDHSLHIYGLEPAQTYEIRLRPGAQDIYGNVITQEYTYTFTNGHLAPSAWLKTYAPTIPFVFRQNVRQEVYLEYTNIETLNLTLYALTPAEFKRLSDYTIPPTNWRTSKSPLRVWELKLEKSPTETRLIPISLEENGKLPPGLYLLGVNSPGIKTSERFTSAALLIVSNEILVLKAAPGEALAWLLDAEEGQPVSDIEVSFYDQDFNLIGTARTDAKGLAHWQSDKNSRPAYAVVNQSGHLAMASPSWSWLYTERFGLYQSYLEKTRQLMAFIYTERPIYRPGQKVYFKGIVRMEDDLRYSLPSETSKITVFISNQDGNLYRQVFSLTPQGTFSGEYTLSEDAPVGTYMLQAYAGEVTAEQANASLLYDTYFRVAEYVKPRFRLDLKGEPERVVSGEPVTFHLNAAYYSGGSLSQAPVEWFIESAPAYYTPPDTYSSYSFHYWEDNPRCAYGYPCQPSPPPLYRQGSGKTDEQGNFEHQENFTLPPNIGALNFTFNVNVQDIGG